MKCLVDNKAKLAPDCAAALDAQNDARHARRSACHTEIQSLCGDTKGPARRACVETNAAKLSAECATRFQKQAERRQSGPGAATQPKQQ